MESAEPSSQHMKVDRHLGRRRDKGQPTTDTYPITEIANTVLFLLLSRCHSGYLS